MTSKETLLYTVASSFEAARKVEILPNSHPSKRLHGHSFLAKIRVDTSGKAEHMNGNEVELLEQDLKNSLSTLDYQYLNEIIDIPTDENIARWLRSNMQVALIDSVGIQSTREQGVDIDQSNTAHIWRRFRFEAAHQLPNVPDGHQCGRMHGHGFEVILHCEQNIFGEDIGIDYDFLAELWQPIHKRLNFSCLNDIKGLENPTSEMLSSWIWNILKPECDSLSWVSVYETSTAGCHFNGSDYRIWKEQNFESAIKLPRTVYDDPRKNLHGHSYLARLHLTCPLDEILGWTVDYGDVKQLFKPVLDQLDHHLLNEIPGFGEQGSTSIASYIKSQISSSIPELDRIDIYEKPGSGVILGWGQNPPILPV